ncbi:hypothetical protein SDC9_163860 [bioreactor metagenome]|uniref:Uncharacterized protein n=1 Tax=bioreactor metagenome TaxID=1076179 RepID=A0A645FS14_9ZZZZ
MIAGHSAGERRDQCDCRLGIQVSAALCQHGRYSAVALVHIIGKKACFNIDASFPAGLLGCLLFIEFSFAIVEILQIVVGDCIQQLDDRLIILNPAILPRSLREHV